MIAFAASIRLKAGFEPALTQKIDPNLALACFVSGERTRLACWFRRLAETSFQKFATARTPSPTRETRALPKARFGCPKLLYAGRAHLVLTYLGLVVGAGGEFIASFTKNSQNSVGS